LKIVKVQIIATSDTKVFQLSEIQPQNLLISGLLLGKFYPAPYSKNRSIGTINKIFSSPDIQVSEIISSSLNNLAFATFS
jgi:hypothetical protein